MKYHFEGYPDKFEFSGIPKPFFNKVMPIIDDIWELKATLVFFKLLFAKKGHHRFVTDLEMVLETAGQMNRNQIQQAMTRSAEHKHIIELSIDNGVSVYLLNDLAGRQSASLIERGEIELPEAGRAVRRVFAVEIPDAFSLYEQNIGMITPIIADEIKEALKSYSEDWVINAITEAARSNKHNWRYISKILENWATQGKNDGTHQRDIQKSTDKYITGKYGKFVKR